MVLVPPPCLCLRFPSTAAGAANLLPVDHIDVGNAVGGWGPDADAKDDWKILSESGASGVDGKEKDHWNTHFETGAQAHEVSEYTPVLLNKQWSQL